MRTLVVGDIHGAHKALVQVLERSGFDRDRDRLISLGDVTDYNPESAEVVEALLEIPHLIAIKGNHDIWTADWLINGFKEPMWVPQGGRETIQSYRDTDKTDDPGHREFFIGQKLYFVDEDNRLYVHAGFDPGKPLDVQGPMVLCWDRKFWEMTGKLWSRGEPIPDFGFRDIFIGHTPTPIYFPHTNPVNFGNVWNLDQGAKAQGRLTIMDADTKEYWQSDPVNLLYGKG
jgi:serine/threonine protein phosphatase 1